MLKELGGGHAPKDADILAWANSTVAASGKATRIASFKDPSIATGCVPCQARRGPPHLPLHSNNNNPPPPRRCSVFLLDLLAAVDPRAVNATLVTTGETPEDLRKNAKYVLSVARKVRKGGVDLGGAREGALDRPAAPPADRRDGLPHVGGHPRRQAQDDHDPPRSGVGQVGGRRRRSSGGRRSVGQRSPCSPTCQGPRPRSGGSRQACSSGQACSTCTRPGGGCPGASPRARGSRT